MAIRNPFATNKSQEWQNTAGKELIECSFENIEAFKKAGFKFQGEPKNGWYPEVELPTGWSTKSYYQIGLIKIVDDRGNVRGMVQEYKNCIKKVKGKVRYTTVIEVNLNNRYEVFRKEVFKDAVYYLIDNLTKKVQQIDIDELSVYEGDDRISIIDDISMVKYRVSQMFPGWDDPSNWYDNPIRKIME